MPKLDEVTLLQMDGILTTEETIEVADDATSEEIRVAIDDKALDFRTGVWDSTWVFENDEEIEYFAN